MLLPSNSVKHDTPLRCPGDRLTRTIANAAGVILLDAIGRRVGGEQLAAHLALAREMSVLDLAHAQVTLHGRIDLVLRGSMSGIMCYPPSWVM